MKTTERFDNAVKKLYNAFHENRLEGNNCQACAVGNLCDNDGSWYPFVSSARPSTEGSYFDDTQLPLISNVPENDVMIKTGYSGNQLAKIESLFVKHSYSDKDKESQFLGLCAVVEYLCELDNIPNVMDYTKLFEKENNKPKYKLS